ncbi:MAG: FAD-dependent oxidoreductase [Muribaculaceae bacterium]|nr:FAD-dependent oxidoreductase [Muribaculaceae bacterium]
MEKFDLGIIGAGPAGYTAALHAANSGKKVVLFEKEHIGGVCLNKGCIPTKSILHASELYHKFQNCQNYGISADNITLDYSKIIERKNNTIEKLRKGIELALKNSKVTVINSEAKILDKNTIKTENETFNCAKIICAQGSRPRELKGLEFDHKFILSSDDILNLDSLPKSILIIGSGAIGIEWARIFSNFGVETTIIELAEHLLPLADIEVSKRIERIFKTKKIKFFTKTSIEKIENNEVKLSNNETLTPEIILSAVGRIPNHSAQVEGVEYIGDESGEIQLAHFGIKQALACTQNIAFRKDLTPSVVYGSPEIAWVGKREQDLNGDYQKSLTLICSLGKAHCDGETEGFIKLLAQDNRIVGAHIVSQEASALIQQIVIAMQNDITAEKLKEICFAHPTYSEGIFDGLFKLK